MTDSLRDSLQRLAQAGHERYNSREGEGDYLGKVTAVNATRHTCDVQVAGDTNATQNVVYEPDLLLSVGDYVIVHRLGPMRFRVTSRAHPSGTTPVVTTQTANLAADVAMTNASQHYDGPLITIAFGTWLVLGTITVAWGNANMGQIWGRLWDGTTSLAGAQLQSTNNGSYYSLSMSAIVTVTVSTTYRLSAATAWAGATIKAAQDGPGGQPAVASHIRAIRVPS